MKKSGMGTAVGLVGVAVTFSLAACTGTKPPVHRTETFFLGERGGPEGTSLPPLQVKFEEMGDFPPVGSARMPLNLELEQNPPLPPIQFNVEEMGDFPPVGTPRLILEPGIKQK
jgi:hypothetical protein